MMYSQRTVSSPNLIQCQRRDPLRRAGFHWFDFSDSIMVFSVGFGECHAVAKVGEKASIRGPLAGSS